MPKHSNLHIYEPNMTYEEIAKQLGITHAGVRKIIDRALTKLKEFEYLKEHL